MILLLWKYTKLLFVLLASLLVFLGREARPLLVGGYTRKDPRNPLAVRDRVEAYEHEMLPGPYKHSEDCYTCYGFSPEWRYSIAYTYEAHPQRDVLWVCKDCGDFEPHRYSNLMTKHWVETGHINYLVPKAGDWHLHYNACRFMENPKGWTYPPKVEYNDWILDPPRPPKNKFARAIKSSAWI